LIYADSNFSYDDSENPDETLLSELIGAQPAHRLLEWLGTLRAISTADTATLLAAGITRAQAHRIETAFLLARTGASMPNARVVSSPAEAATVLVPRFSMAETEEVHVLYLDTRSRLIRARCLAVGGVDHAVFDLREILGGALRVRATALVVAHNHPSGDIEPSNPDILATRRLHDASMVLGVRLVDHLIVAGSRWSSMAQCGHLPASTGSSPVVALAEG
jgi:DNA repair protein RadC